MTLWLAVAGALLVLGLAPSLWLAMRGNTVERLVGVELGSAVTVLVMLAVTMAAGQSSYLIVPLVLAVLSFTGTLVYVRLLGPRP